MSRRIRWVRIENNHATRQHGLIAYEGQLVADIPCEPLTENYTLLANPVTVPDDLAGLRFSVPPFVVLTLMPPEFNQCPWVATDTLIDSVTGDELRKNRRCGLDVHAEGEHDYGAMR